MLESLAQLEGEALATLGTAKDAAALEQWRIQFLGNSGKLKAALGSLKDVPKDQKPAVGARLNQLKAQLEQAFSERQAAVGGGGGGGTGGVGGGITAPEGQLTFTRPDSSLPVVASAVSFWAVNGQARTAVLYYRRHAGSADSTPLARLRLDRRSLVSAPDGTPIAAGDSLLITMSVTDSGRFIVNFEPSGLVFAAGRPASLTLWYRDADLDFNGDGVIDAADTAAEASFRVWRQETLDQPWLQQATVLTADLDEASTDVGGFTRYAVAY